MNHSSVVKQIMAIVSPRLAEQLGSRLLQAPFSCSSLHHQHALRRVRPLVTAALAEASRQPHKLVFLGTPEVREAVPDTLHCFACLAPIAFEQWSDECSDGQRAMCRWQPPR